MTVKEIVFLGSKPVGFYCLEYLLSQKHALNVNIKAVGTQQHKEFGRQKDVPTLALQHGIHLLEPEEEIPACDLIYSVQYHKILSEQQINRAAQIAVNLHMAPLPEYRGCNQFSFAIIEEAKTFGATIHVLEKGIDSGDILFEKRFPIPEKIWVEELYEMTERAAVALFQRTLKEIVDGNYNPIPQSSLLKERTTSLHYRSDINKLREIDKNWKKEKQERYIRATMMPGFEPPYFLENGKKHFFSKTDL